jgi:four helix bundle protein
VQQEFLNCLIRNKSKDERAKNIEDFLMHNFRKLTIWLNAIQLTKEVYLLVGSMPNDEKFGLTSQIKRCCVSIPSNIAEGSSRSSNKEFCHFLKIALGSCFELETQLILSKELGLLNNSQVDLLITKVIEIEKGISRFIKNLECTI